jgi:hypothetical protein
MVIYKSTGKYRFGQRKPQKVQELAAKWAILNPNGRPCCPPQGLLLRHLP